MYFTTFIMEKKFYQDIFSNRNIAFFILNDMIVVCVEDKDSASEYIPHGFKLGEPDINSNIQDILSERYDIEIRFCEQCGKPFNAGYTTDCGAWYCCEECFDEAMDDDYGEGNWRPTDTEGIYGGFYEFLDKSNNTWEDTGIYYTEWN